MTKVLVAIANNKNRKYIYPTTFLIEKDTIQSQAQSVIAHGSFSVVL